VKRRLAAIGAVLVALLAGATGAAAGSYFTDAAPGSEVLLSGCVVRFSDPDGAPSIYANASHQSTGCTDVSITSAGRLRVTQTVTGATEHPIIFAFAQADETLSARGISCGASGGTDDTEYVCFDARLGRALDLSDPRDLLRMQGRNSNLWVGWAHQNGTNR